jgi:hypothetical protein
MKCLIRMFAEKDQGVLFYETVISHKQQKHSFIECVPMSYDKIEDMPGYFKVRTFLSIYHFFFVFLTAFCL